MIRDFNPKEGQAFQGDVSIVPIPADIAIATTQEITPIDGRLILQEGEITGHHHAIALMEKKTKAPGRPRKTSKTAEKLMADAFAGRIAVPTARMYRDDSVPQEMLRRGILTRTDLVVGCLVIEHGPMTISHEEHDSIRVPPGKYLIGRQVESAGAEERQVRD